MFIDSPTSKRCWNLYESFGEICVHCGCCSKDPLERSRARLRLLKDLLANRKSFDDWSDDPEMAKLQQENIRRDIRTYKRRIRYYEDKVKWHEAHRKEKK